VNIRPGRSIDMTPRQCTRMAAAVALLVAAVGGIWQSAGVHAQSRWGANYFPNVALTTHKGDVVHFYDLIKGKIVAIELIYTSCEYSCPLETARLVQVQRLLGDRMGRDVFFYSISIDPEHDTPAVLKGYAEHYGAGPNWLFLTGKAADIELLSKKLGLYTDPNPENKDGHTPTLLIGNEATGQWMRGSALDNPKFTAQVIGNWMNNWATAKPGKSYDQATPLQPAAKAQYLFATKCVTCHTIGQGEKIGPDLAEALATRDREWLARYIVAPDKMRAGGDPIATALLEKYSTVRMPNLNVSEAEAAEMLAYIESQPRHATKP
jgi:protein SCO1/2